MSAKVQPGTLWRRIAGPYEGSQLVVLEPYPDDPDDMVRGRATDEVDGAGCKLPESMFLERYQLCRWQYDFDTMSASLKRARHAREIACRYPPYSFQEKRWNEHALALEAEALLVKFQNVETRPSPGAEPW